jgi:hypothetical protein
MVWRVLLLSGPPPYTEEILVDWSAMTREVPEEDTRRSTRA